MKYLRNKLIDIPENRMAIFFFILSFILRFTYALYAYYNNVMEKFDDDLYYFSFAKEVLSQGTAFYNIPTTYLHDVIGPGLPWINSLTMLIFGENWLGIFFITSFISALLTVFSYKVAIIVANRESAFLTALWSSFYLFYYMYTPTSGKEIWMSFFLILIIYFLLTLFYKNEFSNVKFVMFVFIYVFSFHLDERFFMFSMFIVIYILIFETSWFSKLKVKKSAFFIFLLCLFMIPWVLRNYRVYNKIVLISTRTERLTDKIFGYESRPHEFDNIDDLYGRYYIHEYQIDSILTGEKKVTDGGYHISEQQRQAMIKGYMPKPLTFIQAFWIRTKDMLRPFQIGGEYQKTGYYYYEKSLRNNISSFLFYGIMLIFSIPGFIYLYKRKQIIFYLFIITIAVYTLIHALFIPWTTWRYRLPLDSIFIIVGSLGIIKTFYFRRSKLDNIIE